jgi:hypothetical protein
LLRLNRGWSVAACDFVFGFQCLEHVAFKRFASQMDMGFELRNEYQSPLSLYERRQRKK